MRDDARCCTSKLILSSARISILVARSPILTELRREPILAVGRDSRVQVPALEIIVPGRQDNRYAMKSWFRSAYLHWGTAPCLPTEFFLPPSNYILCCSLIIPNPASHAV